MAQSRFLGAGADQSLNTTDSPTFAGVTLANAGNVFFRNQSDTGSVRVIDMNSDNLRVGPGDSSTNGGSVDVLGGEVVGEAQGGNVTLRAGRSSAWDGGLVQIYGGAAVADGTPAGKVEIFGGTHDHASGVGADIELTGGYGAGGLGSVKVKNPNTAEVVVSIKEAMRLTPVAFASLPASPEEGSLSWVNDSSTAVWGATIAGGGANKVLAVFNGSNWTCAGK